MKYRTVVYLCLASTKRRLNGTCHIVLHWYSRLKYFAHTVPSISSFCQLTYFFQPTVTLNLSAILSWSSGSVRSRRKVSFHFDISHTSVSSSNVGFNRLTYLGRFGLVYNGSNCIYLLAFSSFGTSDNNWKNNKILQINISSQLGVKSTWD